MSRAIERDKKYLIDKMSKWPVIINPERNSAKRRFQTVSLSPDPARFHIIYS